MQRFQLRLEKGNSRLAIILRTDILAGLNDVPESHLGNRAPCHFCHAQLWSHEVMWTTMCCHKGHVSPVLSAIPAPGTPQYDILNLWAEDSARDSLLRKFSRQCNNAVSLASQNVTEPAVPGHGWKPTVIIQGRLHHRVGALCANAGDAPRFAQLYMCDPQHEEEEAQARLDWQCLPAGTSDLEKDQLALLLCSLQGYLWICNPYIQDFLLALEIPATQIDQGHLIIIADA